MSTPAHPAAPTVFCPRSTSKLVAALFRKLASHPDSMESSMLRHLRSIEDIEARIAARDLAPDEIISLVALGHETINEIQRLHLREEIRRLYVTRRKQGPLGLASV